jgi:vancomycin resistance protein VanJ
LKLKNLFRSGARWLSIAYLLALLLVAACLYFIGEGWWISGVLMYLPQLGWALPLPLVVGLLAWTRQWRQLQLQLAGALVWLFVLMGFNLPWPQFSGAAAPKMRVLSFNVNSCYSGVEVVAAKIREHGADLVLVQELFGNDEPLAAALRKDYPAVQFDGQFLIASRYPILTSKVPPRVAVGDAMRTARFVRYVVQTPFGELAVYNMHPISPRGALWKLRKGGFRKQLLQGHALDGEVEEDTQGYAQVRLAQAKAAADMAKAEPGLVLIAGDTNLPSFSPALRRTFGAFQDGFSEAGWGFGFTYPDRIPWMRIDRIMASNGLKFVDFQRGCQGASDHLCVVAELERREP